MNDKLTISTFDLFKMFPDQESARTYLESRLWPNGAKCPCCGLGERITVRKGGYYRCNQCKEDFTVRTGTIFERSHVQLHKWLYAMYLLVTARKGISSLQLSKEIGVTQKTAWFMLQRLREEWLTPTELKVFGLFSSEASTVRFTNLAPSTRSATSMNSLSDSIKEASASRHLTGLTA